MKNVLAASAAVAALVGGSAAFVVASLLDDAGEARRAMDARRGTSVDVPPVPTSGGGSSTPEDVARQLSALREQNLALVARIADLESALAERTTRIASTPERPIETVPASDARALASDNDELTPEFVASVNDALESIREEERLAAETAWREEQLTRASTKVDRLSDKLSLNGYQAEELRKLLYDRELRREEITRIADELEDRSGMKESLRELRHESDAALATILTPEQMKLWTRIEGKNDDKRFGPGETSSKDAARDTARAKRSRD